MPDLDPHEILALEYASSQAGEYLEDLKKTDLAKFTPEEWGAFIEIIAINYQQKRFELAPCPF